MMGKESYPTPPALTGPSNTLKSKWRENMLPSFSCKTVSDRTVDSENLYLLRNVYTELEEASPSTTDFTDRGNLVNASSNGPAHSPFKYDHGVLVSKTVDVESQTYSQPHETLRPERAFLGHEKV
ncbi:hypothetical protein MMC13_004341 [Lambiella insularis]|nr:hypothetical protein [Lambiella insularis]